MIELEFHQLDRKYEGLRVIEPARQARLLASLAEHGQQNPVWVVAAADRRVLIDGYRRCSALERLGRDTVLAVDLQLEEQEALLLSACPEGSGRRSAIEEAWLLRELHERFRLGLEELAIRFGRSRSWACRRLALAGTLPDVVVDAVRSGVICAHAAMKHLAPLARANGEQCIALVKALAGSHLSERDLGRIYAGWRDSDAIARERIVRAPLLYLAATDEAADPEPPCAGKDLDDAILRDLESLTAIAHRVRRHIRVRTKAADRWSAELESDWKEAERAFYLLRSTFRTEVVDAGS